MKEVEIYTDGACSGNPGPGGYAAILSYKNNRMEISGREAQTTNNRMELKGVIEGLKALKEPCSVKLYSDSAYVVNAFNSKWIDKWKSNGWKTATGSKVINKDLWEQLSELVKTHSAEFCKVKGHSDNELNERCDQLAREAIKELNHE